MVVSSRSRAQPPQNRWTGLVSVPHSFANIAADEDQDGSVFRVRLPSVLPSLHDLLISRSLGNDHLPHDAIDSDDGMGLGQTTYGQGIIDEAMQWNRDRETSSGDSSSDSGITPSAESSAQGSRGINPNTLYFRKEDVIMLVDGELPVLDGGKLAAN